LIVSRIEFCKSYYPFPIVLLVSTKRYFFFKPMPAPYIPSHFAASDATAQAIVAAHPFATFITVHSGEVFVTQIPMIFRDSNTLIGHMARANPHSAALLAGAAAIEATMQFTGVNGYISPAWYVVNTGVPTWNYQTVQARGTVKLMDGLPQTEAVVKALIDAFDSLPELVKQAWADSPPNAQATQLGAILAFEVRLSACQAKTKLSQNRPLADRPRIVAALEAGSDNDRLMAIVVRGAML
jgi:transcriptional regulator